MAETLLPFLGHLCVLQTASEEAHDPSGPPPAPPQLARVSHQDMLRQQSCGTALIPAPPGGSASAMEPTYSAASSEVRPDVNTAERINSGQNPQCASHLLRPPIRICCCPVVYGFRSWLMLLICFSGSQLGSHNTNLGFCIRQWCDDRLLLLRSGAVNSF